MGNTTRRSFLQKLAATGATLGLSPWTLNSMLASRPNLASTSSGEATMLSTWNHGIEANAAGFHALQQGGNAMDMIEAGARLVEADATGLSVGIGGLPDRDGNATHVVTLTHGAIPLLQLRVHALEPQRITVIGWSKP